MLRGKHVYYIYADHLDTPRVIVNRANNVIWRWDSDPFGNASSRQEGEDGDDEGDHDESESDDSEFTYNLRFPGQYFDKETGLHYNYFRDYDPRAGRYVQSDPIGLEGGLNTYAYVGGNPVSYYDPDGLSLTSAVVGTLPAICRANPLACARTGISLPKIPAPGPVGAVVGAGAAGYAVGSLIYPQIAQPLGGLIDAAVKMCSSNNKDNFCFSRWEQEDSACWRWKSLGMRAVGACKTRAATRRNLCVSNGGRPNPSEPPEYNPFRDYPR